MQEETVLSESEPDVWPEPPAQEGWSFVKKLLFRFGLLYFLLYTHPFPLNYVPNPQSIAVALEKDWSWTATSQPFFDKLTAYSTWFQERQNDAVDWTAHEVFQIEHALDRPYGSGDPTHAYVQLALLLALAAIGTLVWSLLDRREGAHRRLAPWLHLGARYVLAMTLFGYGFAKVIPTQFGFPRLSRLVTDYGHASPMNVLWSFMGVSTAYIVFAGAAEVLAGALLIFRRTATLGALVAVATMANVVAMNFSYDVPVKLYSSHLLLLALLLCLPDLRRLLRVLLLNRATERRDLSRPRTPIFGHLVRLLVVVPTLFLQVRGSLTYYEGRNERPELYGIWDVQRYALDGEDVPPLTTDPQRWRRLLVEGATFGYVQGMDDTLRSAGLAVDEEASTLTLTASSTWSYTREANVLALAGEFDRWFRADPGDSALPAVPVDAQVEMRLEREGDAPEPGSDAPSEIEGEVPSTPPAALLGTWTVTGREVVGELLASRRSDPTEWAEMTLEATGVARVEFADGRVDVYTVTVDEALGRLTFATSATLALERPTPVTMRLSGEFRGHELTVDLLRRDLDDYLLVRRGFHWINEVPLNRY